MSNFVDLLQMPVAVGGGTCFGAAYLTGLRVIEKRVKNSNVAGDSYQSVPSYQKHEEGVTLSDRLLKYICLQFGKEEDFNEWKGKRQPAVEEVKKRQKR